LIPFFEKDSKTYEFKINLNGWTESYDLEKEINFIEKDLEEKLKKELTLEKISEIINKNFI
jgi:tRNA U55 pseudouridine synthase TruB